MSRKKANADGKFPTQYLLPKFSLTIKVVVGFYLLYTSYELMDGVVSGEGRDKYLLGAFMVGFAIAGILLIFFCGRSLLQGKYVGGALDAGEGEEDSEEAHEAEEDERTGAVLTGPEADGKQDSGEGE